ncbi:hypothetical protein K3495_g12023 [Podosphaera aphanis]|nr:hypothetical protein K3495_g12023 [Podosphaera aphanis]
MDISQESQALSTERSQQPPPIPPIPPIHNPSPPIASPSSSSQTLPSTTSAAGRQMLKPVAPSKRPIPERPQHNSRDNSDIANAFIPKELAEIIATRQHRERTWHARLILCTTVISNLESTLTNFTDEIEKKEAVALKAYLRQAVANFAAAESPPAPPCVPLHTRPGNRNGREKEKEKNLPKKVAVAIPKTIPKQVFNQGSTNEVEQLNVLPNSNNTWATVARKGQKKARVVNVQVLKADTRIRGTQKPSNKEKTASTVSDKRLFIRLPIEHEWRKLSPAGIREVVVKTLMISPTLIGKIKPVHSGFALSPCSTEARETILNAGNGLFLSGAKLEEASNWISVIVPTVPLTIRTEQGEIEVSKSMLTDEIERVSSIRPAHVKFYGANKAEAPHRTWMAYFTKAPRTAFRVFDESGIARRFKKQQSLDFCKRCNGHHPTKNCSRAPSYGNCGSTNHLEDSCMAATKCRNCGGPHRSESRKCLACPTRTGAPTKQQMKTYRQAGEREYQAVLRSKAAEEAAAAAENSKSDLTNSQSSEVDVEIDNIPASPVVISTGDAMRL